MSSANCELQSGRPPVDSDDSGISVSSLSSTAQPGKQPSLMDAEVSKISALSFFQGIY